jgi:TP901 family phage tail tape measure protein
LADIDITFGGDASPLQNVIGRLNKEMLNFAKLSESAFGGAESSINDLAKAGAEYNRVLDEQTSKLRKIEKSSSFPTPGTSGRGFGDDQIKAIQAGLTESTRGASKIAAEFAAQLQRATSGLNDDQIKSIQAALSESVRQASELTGQFNNVNSASQSSVEFLRQQVAQYEQALRLQNEISANLSKSKEIELAAKPQAPTSAIGLTPDQIRQVQAALAESAAEAARLRDEFLKNNAALNIGTDIVKRTGSELVKTFSTDLVRRVGTDIVKYTGNVAAAGAATKQVTNDTSAWGKAFGVLSKAWNSELPSLRYALYDVSNNLKAFSAITLGSAIVPIGLSIKYEREFANVIRTNELVGNSMEETRKKLRDELQTIAETTPISWADVTNIATLAGQLGIAGNVIGNFTESVAKFAATTDLTVDAAATAFGRLDQLIDGVDGNFEALGSAILAVGVDSVATESQIVNVSREIASMGNLAGLTAPEIIGLSGALASLGIRPELARGTITRLFSDIGQAAVSGGYEVEEFGRLTGRTASEFVSDWETRPGAVLQDFFDGINSEGPEAERTLRRLGITSVRDIPAILRLAQSSDEVRRLIALSSDEYLYATKLNEQYGVISGTTAEQLNRLSQNFQTLGAAIGDSVGPLAAYFQFLNNVIQGLTVIAQSPVGQLLSGVALVFALVLGSVTALGGALIGLIAAKVALNFASKQLGITLSFSVVKALLTSKAATDALTTSSIAASASLRVMGSVLRSLGIVGAIVGVLGILVSLLGNVGDKSSEADENVQKFFGSLDGLRDAIDRDTESFDELTGKMKDGSDAIVVFDKEAKSSAGAFDGVTEGANQFVDANGEIVTSLEDVDGAIDKVDGKTFAVGPETLDFLAGAIIKDADIAKAFADPGFQQAWVAAGGNLADLLRAGLEGEGGAYLDGIKTQIQSEISALLEERKILNAAEDYSNPRYAEIGEEIDAYKSQIETIDGPLRTFVETQSLAVDQATELGVGVSNVSEELDELVDRSVLADDALKDILNTLFSAANYTKDVENAFNDFAEAMRNGEESAQSASGEIQDVIESILAEPDGNVDIILTNLNGLLLFLQAQGPGTAASQELVRRAIELVGAQARIEAGSLFAYGTTLARLGDFVPTDFAALFDSAMANVESSADRAGGKVKTLSDQFEELTSSMFESINLGRDAEDAIFALGEAFGESGDEALYASDEMQDAIGAILKQSDSGEQGVANLAALFSQLAKTAGGESAPSLQILRQAISQVGAQFGISEAQVQQFIATAGGGLANINTDNFTRGVQNAQKEVRTLLDYASDLENVFSRAFDIRFAETFALDDIAEAFQKLSESVEDARFELEELQASQSDLGADRGLKEYFLSIAEAYGDTLRAAQLRKEIAELDREQAENQRKLEEAQAIAGGDLTGQGPGQRQNRQALLGLVGDYQDYITALAESGATQEELRAATEQARQEFIQQATELGFQESVVLEYAAAFDDVQTAISKVERNITVEANVNPALQALNELRSGLQKTINKARELNTTLGQPNPPTTPTTPTTPTSPPLLTDINLGIFGQPIFGQSIFATGGFTGRGGAMEPAGIVHKGEYVVPKQYVNQSTGMPDASFLAQLQNGVRSFTMGGSAGPMGGDGTVMVELSPFDRKLLENAGNVQLRLNGRVVAEATNQNNFQQARRGSD